MRIACVQLRARDVGDADRALEEALGAADQAARHGPNRPVADDIGTGSHLLLPREREWKLNVHRAEPLNRPLSEMRSRRSIDPPSPPDTQRHEEHSVLVRPGFEYELGHVRPYAVPDDDVGPAEHESPNDLGSRSLFAGEQADHPCPALHELSRLVRPVTEPEAPVLGR